MTEHLSPKLIAEEEASRIIVAEIRAYPQGGDKREEHLRLFGELLPREEIEALWAERYAEIARIEEAKPKVAYRRYAKKEQSSANAAQSFSVPATQPAADGAPKNAQEERPFSLPAVLPAKRLEAKRIESKKGHEQKAKADGAVGVLDPSNPLAIAKRFISLRGQYNGTRIIHRWRGKFWSWRDNHYRPTDDDAVRTALYNFLSTGEVEVRMGAVSAYVSLKPNKGMVNNVLDALGAAAFLDQEHEMPSWFGDEEIENSNELVAMRNGLLYLPTRKLMPHSPDFFSANILDFEYNPNARATRFKQFLQEVWPNDRQTHRAVLEMFGLCLTDETRCQKAFMFVGPKRGGRGTMGRLLRALIGPENFVGASFSQFSTDFGLESWIGKKIAVFTDATLDGVSKHKHGVIAGELKRITGEDPMSIRQKYTRDWQGILRARVLIFSNEMLHFQDASGALPSRFHTFKMRQSFEGREDKTLIDKLLAERPGIFNLALDALDNLRERCWTFIQPETGEEMLEELKDLSALVRVFVKDRCDVRASLSIPVTRLYSSYSGWCEIHGHWPGSLETFSTKLRAQFSTISSSRPRSIDGEPNPTRQTVLHGIALAKKQW